MLHLYINICIFINNATFTFTFPALLTAKLPKSLTTSNRQVSLTPTSAVKQPAAKHNFKITDLIVLGSLQSQNMSTINPTNYYC